LEELKENIKYLSRNDLCPRYTEYLHNTSLERYRYHNLLDYKAVYKQKNIGLRCKKFSDHVVFANAAEVGGGLL
jgi:hypothetical protein